MCYRGNRYKLKDSIVSLNIDSHVEHCPEMDKGEVNEHILGVILIHQYNLKKGLELFGDKAELTTVKELKQIHDMGTYVPMNPKELTREQKAKALSSLMFIVENVMGALRRESALLAANKERLKDTTGLNGHHLQ